MITSRELAENYAETVHQLASVVEPHIATMLYHVATGNASSRTIGALREWGQSQKGREALKMLKQVKQANGDNIVIGGGDFTDGHQAELAYQTRHPPVAKGTPGTVSQATMRPQDLIPTFLDELEALWPWKAAYLRREYPEYDDNLDDTALFWNSDAAMRLLPDLLDALNEVAPPFCSFGARQADGADYGFWYDWDYVEAIANGHIKGGKGETQAQAVALLSEYGGGT